MHLGDCQFALDEQLDLVLNLFVTDDVLVFDLNRVVVVHADVSRTQITDSVRTPLKLAADRTVR